MSTPAGLSNEQGAYDDLYTAIQKNDTETGMALLDAGIIPFHLKENIEINSHCDTNTHPHSDTNEHAEDHSKDQIEIQMSREGTHHSTTWTTLHWASLHGNEKLVSRILHACGTRETSFWITNSSPLMWAAKRGHLAVCWILLLASFSLDDKDERGNSPLHYAASGGRQNVTKCLIENGADLHLKNCFNFTPFQTASTEAVRDMLKQALTEQGKLDSEGRANKRRYQEEKYKNMKSELEDLILGYDIEKLERSIMDATEFGIIQDIINLGHHRKKWLLVRAEVSSQIDLVKQNAPIIQKDQYEEYVEPLLSIIISVEEMIDKDLDTPLEIKELLTKAIDFCCVSKSELSLKSSMIPLESVASASPSNEDEISLLRETIEKSKEMNVDKDFLSEALVLFAKVESELNLKESIDALPTVRLPIPDMTTKEEKEYWSSEDLGMIEETEEYPLLPKDANEYTWIESKSLQALKKACNDLRERIDEAKASGGNEDLISSSSDRLETKLSEVSSLQDKNETDRALAVKDAEKAAKKLVKSKRKKQKKKN